MRECESEFHLEGGDGRQVCSRVHRVVGGEGIARGADIGVRPLNAPMHVSADAWELVPIHPHHAHAVGLTAPPQVKHGQSHHPRALVRVAGHYGSGGRGVVVVVVAGV